MQCPINLLVERGQVVYFVQAYTYSTRLCTRCMIRICHNSLLFLLFFLVASHHHKENSLRMPCYPWLDKNAHTTRCDSYIDICASNRPVRTVCLTNQCWTKFCAWGGKNMKRGRVIHPLPTFINQQIGARVDLPA